MATAAMFEPGDENRTNDDDDEGIGFPQSLFLLWIPHKERAVRKIDARVMWKVRKARNAHLEIVDRAFQRLLARLQNVCFAGGFYFLSEPGRAAFFQIQNIATNNPGVSVIGKRIISGKL